MNGLSQFLVDSILKEDDDNLGVVALFGGGFKPPTRGHLEVVLQGLQENPEVTQVYILVGSGVRNNVSQAEAVKIWEMYQKFIPVSSQIIPVQSPFSYIKTYLQDHQDEKVYVFIGARPDNEEDEKDVAERSAYAKKYSKNAMPVKVQTKGGVSGTMARKAALSGNTEEFISYFPSELTDAEKQEIIDMVSSVVKEQVDFKSLESQLDNMFAELDIDVAFTNHFKERVLERGLTEEDIIELANKIIDQYPDELDFIDKGQNIVMSHLSRLVDIAAVNTGYGDDYLKDLVFKTAYKRKDKSEPEFRTNSSSPRLSVKEDLSFEKKKALITKIVKLAQSSGEHMSVDRLADLIARKIKIDTDSKPAPGSFKVISGKPFVEGSDPKKGTGKKPEGSGRRLYTDEDPSDTVGIKFSTRQDIVDTLNKKSFKAKSHARQSQIINLIHQRVRAAYGRAKDPDVKKRLKTALDYAEQRKEASKAKTQRLKKQKMNENASYSSDIDYKSLIKELTKYMIESGWNIQPLPKVVFKHGDSENARDFFGKTAYYDPNTKTIVLYTEGRHPKDIARSFSHEMVHHEQNLDGRLGDIQTTNTQEDDRLNDIEKEANLKGTMTFRNWTDSLQEKKNKDPFGLNQYARELAQGLEEAILNEGRYDKFTNQISRIVFEMFKDIHDRGDKKGEFEFSVGPDDEDIYSEDFEFDLAGVVEITDDLYKVDGGANAGFDDKGDEITPLLSVKFKIPKNPDWQKVSFDIKDVVRHELEHLTQDGLNVKGVVVDPKDSRLDRPGKQMDDDQFIRDMIDADMLPKADYFKLKKEIDAMMQGLYYKAKKSRRPFKDVIDDYLATQPISQEEKETILNLWRSRNKALNLPVFESETGEMPEESSNLFTIYLDMDGVIVDFDKRFKDLFGMPPREFEDNFGSDKFWEKIDSKGVGFWRGMDWMPGGQQLYNRVAKHDHALLSSPSRSDISKIGKRMWRKDNTPNTKLILARSYNKKNYADKSNILIDDRADNIQQWKDAGGIGILYQSADQVMKELDKLGL